MNQRGPWEGGKNKVHKRGRAAKKRKEAPESFNDKDNLRKPENKGKGRGVGRLTKSGGGQSESLKEGGGPCGRENKRLQMTDKGAGARDMPAEQRVSKKGAEGGKKKEWS